MLFSITRAFATQQKYINNILYNYLDNILIYSKAYAKYKKYLKAVISCFKKAKLYVKVKRCKFFIIKIKILKLIIKYNRIKINLKKVKTIKKQLTFKNIINV